MSEAISNIVREIASAGKRRLAMTGVSIFNAHIVPVQRKKTVNEV